MKHLLLISLLVISCFLDIFIGIVADGSDAAGSITTRKIVENSENEISVKVPNEENPYINNIQRLVYDPETNLMTFTSQSQGKSENVQRGKSYFYKKQSNFNTAQSYTFKPSKDIMNKMEMKEKKQTKSNHDDGIDMILKKADESIIEKANEIIKRVSNKKNKKL